MAKSSLKILLIDAHKDNLISLRALILETFPEAITLMAENGSAGIEMALSEDPDVVLLDVVMPGLDGFEVCQKLKSNSLTRDIPVVFLTALKGDKQSRIQALEVGAEAFLAKPIDEIELTAQIRAMQKIKIANNQKWQEKETLAQQVAEKTRELNQAQVTYDGEKPVLLHGVVQDITERKQAKETLRNSNKKYQILFETLSEGVALNEVIYDDGGEMVDYRILEVNPAFYEIADYAGPVLGNVATKLYGMTSDFIKAFWRQHIHQKTVQTVEMTSPLRGRTYLVSTSPFENDRFVTSFMDITERKKAEIALRDNELALNKAQQVAHVGSWTWYISQDRLEWSDEMYRIFGIEKVGFTEKLSEVIPNAIHPDDRATVEQSNNSVIQEEKPIPLEYRIIRPDGTVRMVWAEAGDLILNADGLPEVLTGIVQDITERKLIEQKNNDQLNELRRWYSAMLGREKRTIELKKEVNDLLVQAGLPPRYADPMHTSRE